MYKKACNTDKLVEKLPVMLMNVKCIGCESLNFAGEVDKNGYSRICCQKGKVSLPHLKEVPEFIKNMLISNNKFAKNFQDNITTYNSAL